MRHLKPFTFVAVIGACTLAQIACLARSNIGPAITVENIRAIRIGMSRQDVERFLGVPLHVEADNATRTTTERVDTLVYFRRLPPPLAYPMLWVHLRDGKVAEVYAKRHGLFDSWGVYGRSAARQWETAEFLSTFPASGHRTR
jgi:hypothetical protein